MYVKINHNTLMFVRKFLFCMTCLLQWYIASGELLYILKTKYLSGTSEEYDLEIIYHQVPFFLTLHDKMKVTPFLFVWILLNINAVFGKLFFLIHVEYLIS
jgi:hypothetical protein